MSKHLDRLTHLLRALQCGILLRTTEENRALETIWSAASSLDTERPVFVWSSASGLAKMVLEETPNGPRLGREVVSEGAVVKEAFVFAATQQTPSVITMLDAQEGFEGSAKRYCREALAACRRMGSSIIFVGNEYTLPVELRSDVWVMDMPLPTRDEIQEYVGGVADRFKAKGDVEIDQKAIPVFSRTCQGLSLGEVQSILSLSAVKHNGITMDAVDEANAEKLQVVRREGVLEIETPRFGIKDVGGLSLLKEWAFERLGLFDESARAEGIEVPRGVILTGVGGTGKTMFARMLASYWKCNLLRLDMGKLFGQYLGQSEANARRAIQVAESCAPCVLLLDEMDKGMGKANGGADSGSSNRVLSTFLTWLQDKTSEVFVVGTCNHLQMLDPAMLRAGRFDAVFYCDLPSKAAREEIFRIYLDGKLGGIKSADVATFAGATEGYVGSEIKQVVQNARVTARNAGSKMTADLMLAKIKEFVPVSVTMKDEIDQMRALVKSGRVRLADKPDASGNWLGSNVNALPSLNLNLKKKGT
jgi:ATP-dependent 26S proteasome regulatory subunit